VTDRFVSTQIHIRKPRRLLLLVNHCHFLYNWKGSCFCLSILLYCHHIVEPCCDYLWRLTCRSIFNVGVLQSAWQGLILSSLQRRSQQIKQEKPKSRISIVFSMPSESKRYANRANRITPNHYLLDLQLSYVSCKNMAKFPEFSD
jgi:hypothetical protein